MPLSTRETQSFAARLGAIRSINPSKIVPKSERPKLSITNVKKGGVIRIGKSTFQVTGVATATETDKSFQRRKNYVVTEFTLFCLETGETRYLEWSKDDVVEICLTDRELFESDVRVNGTPISADEMEELIEEEATLRFDGKSFPYDDDCHFVFESDDGRVEHLFAAEFGTENVGWLTIERWSEPDGSDPEYQIWYSENYHPTSIEILSLGGDQ